MSTVVPATLHAHSLDRARRLVLAASRLAQETLRGCGPRRPAWIVADAAQASRVFAAALDGPAPTLDALLDAFVPTTLLATRLRVKPPPDAASPQQGARVQALDDGVHYPYWVGASAVCCTDPPGEPALGDTWLLPPVRADEAVRRQRWIEERLIDPTPHAEPGGPFWRLGTWNAWRLDSLGWPEWLTLLGLTGTACTASVVLGPPELVPHVGFVPASAVRLGRTLVFVSTLSLEPRVRAAMQFRHRRAPVRPSSFLFLPEVWT